MSQTYTMTNFQRTMRFELMINLYVGNRTYTIKNVQRNMMLELMILSQACVTLSDGKSPAAKSRFGSEAVAPGK